ncbi:hypothetical protein EV641_109216 [Rhodococcus sp. SMB37]|nr:hypothetical protein EV641_109216 [Rhodococcus sp. SMB37]
MSVDPTTSADRTTTTRPWDNDADACRARGWRPGTRLAGDEGYGVTVIEITALGDRLVLAKRISHKGEPVEQRESSWTLSCRDWKEVPS